MKYNKLVRDKIPEIISRKCEHVVAHVANDEELWIKLKEKLFEEAHEFLKANPEGELEELADVAEVIDTIMQFGKFSAEKLDRAKDEKRREKGGFKERIILEES